MKIFKKFTFWILALSIIIMSGVLDDVAYAQTATPSPTDTPTPSVVCADITEIPVIECEALEALYDSTDGPNWANNTRWFQTDNPCGWFGITCNDGQVQELKLGENQLNGQIPAELGNFSILKVLYLYKNQLGGPIPTELGRLSNLEDLFAYDNQLSGPIPSELGNLEKLTELALSNNQFSGIIPAELGNLSNLKILGIFGNQLSGIIPPELGNLSSLINLDIGRNQLSGTIPSELGILSSLNSLRLVENQIGGSIPPELGALSNLTFLSLSRNQLSGKVPPQLGNLSNLTGLYLEQNQLSGEIPPQLGNLANLVSLWFKNNQLIGEIPPELGNLSSLVSLVINSNQLSGGIPKELGNLLELNTLALSSNQLEGSLPSELGNLSNLIYLYVNNNQLSGPIPSNFTSLNSLGDLRYNNTQLCEPDNPEFEDWLASIESVSRTDRTCTSESESWAGTITDEKGNPLSAAVDINGVQGKAGSDGKFEIAVPPAEDSRYVIHVEKQGYVPISLIHVGSALQGLTIQLQQPEQFEIDPQKPIDVTDSDGTRIVIEAGKLVDANGNPAQVPLQLLLYTYDLTREEMVGDMSGIDRSGELASMESAGAFYAKFVDANGTTYNLATGAEAEVSIPGDQAEIVRDGLTMWSYDEESGLWREEADTKYDNGRYIGRVSHFSFWNFDWKTYEPACIKLTVDTDYLAANTPPPIRVKAVLQTIPLRTRFLDLNEPTNALYNLAANTDVHFFMPPYDKPPFAIINSGAPWGGTGVPPFPYDVCNGIADFSGRGTVQGTKFHDLDGDGVRDRGEPGLPGWTIEFRDAAGVLIASVVTGYDGSYTAELESGTYIVSEMPQDDWEQTFPAIPGSHTVEVGIGGIVDNIDFGNKYVPDSCGPTDVVFVLDDTGSMFSAINNVKNDLNTIVNRIIGVSGGDYQLGLVTFKDYIRVHNDLAAGNVAAVQANINGLTTGGGSLTPEASDEALNTVINNLIAAGRPQDVDFSTPWRPDAHKLIILVTDAVPGGFDDTYTAGTDDVNANTRAVEAQNAGIKINALHVGSSPIAVTIMQNYASTTGGAYVDLDFSGVGTADAIHEIIKECDTGSGEIHGTKWHDLDRNDVQGPNEPGLEGWTILLEDSTGTVISTTTDADGNYWFMDLPASTYSVTEVIQPGWTQVYPASGVHTQSLDDGEVIEDINFGNWQNSDEWCQAGWDINYFNDDPDNSVEVALRIYNTTQTDANYQLDIVGYPGFTVHGFTATTPFNPSQPSPTPPVFVGNQSSVYVALFMSPLPTIIGPSGRYQVIVTNEKTGYSFGCSAQLWQSDIVRVQPKDDILDRAIRPGIAQDIAFEVHNLVDREIVAQIRVEEMFGLPGRDIQAIRLNGRALGAPVLDEMRIPARGIADVVVEVTLTEDVPNGAGDIILSADVDADGVIDAATSVLIHQAAAGSIGPDLYIKDTPLDAGVEPNPDGGPMWISQDIWVRTSPDPNYQPYPYPEGSPTWTPLPHQNPEYRDPKYSTPNYVYVRVRNRGDAPSTGTEELHAYWAKASTGLSWPTQWVDYVTNTCGPTKLFGAEITKPRQNAATASPAERAAYIDAIVDVGTLPAFQFPDSMSYWHKQNQIHIGGTPNRHGSAAFLPWHREYINRYEALLQEADPTVKLLYWDWTTDPENSTGGFNFFTPAFMGASGRGTGGVSIGAPFIPALAPPAITRQLNSSVIPPADSDATLLSIAVYEDFSDDNEASPNHNSAHGYIGGNGNISFPSTAAQDPFFFMLHANADRLWAQWQRDTASLSRLAPTTAYDLDSGDVNTTISMGPWDGAGAISPWTIGDGYIVSKTPKHPSVVSPPIYDTAPLVIPVLQPGEAVILQIPWYPPNPNDFSCFGDQGHFCLLGRIETEDAAPFGMTTPEGAGLGANTRNNNNIAWKNLTVVDNFPGAQRIAPILVRNVFDEPVRTALRFQNTEGFGTSFFEYGDIYVKFPPEIIERWQPDDSVDNKDVKLVDDNTIQIGSPDAYIQNLLLEPGETFAVDVTFELFNDYRLVPDLRPQWDMLQIGTPDDPEELVGGQRFEVDFQKLAIVQREDEWRYLDDGSDIGDDWTALEFDDGAWLQGKAELGFGDDPVTIIRDTKLEQRHITTYFRRTFEVANPDFYRTLILNLKRDDGAIVYLNGKEIHRVNLPTGAVTADTLAQNEVTGLAEEIFYPTDVTEYLELLLTGKNVIAVEVHQDSPDSQDLSFDLALVGNPAVTQQLPNVGFAEPSDGALFLVGQTIPVEVEAIDTDGEVTSVTLFADGVEIGKVEAPPYQFKWAGASLGTHILRAVAQDNDGRQASVDLPIVVVENLPPVVELVSAADGMMFKVGEAIAVSARASDPGGAVKHVEYHLLNMAELFTADAQVFGPVTESPYALEINDLEPGHYMLSAVAVDDEGASSQSLPIHFHVGDMAGDMANVYLTPADGAITISDQYTVEIRIDNIKEFYGNDLSLIFDPTVVEVVDADNAQAGVQIQHGDFFMQDTVLQNIVDNTAGTIQYSTGFQGEKPGVDGSGVLARVVFRGLGAGTSPISFTNVLLSNPQSEAIEAADQGGQITVVSSLFSDIQGLIILERRGDNNNSGAQVCVGMKCTITGDDGSYELKDVPYNGVVTIQRSSYLSSSYPYEAATERTVVITDVTLLGGDINQDGIINIDDAVRTAQARNSTPADPHWHAPADVTDDGNVNLFDMVAVQFNWGKKAPDPWGDVLGSLDGSSPAFLKTPEDVNADTQVVITPASATIEKLNDSAQLDITIADVTDLYGFTVIVTFDATKVQVVDTNPSEDGIQIQLGELLDPTSQIVVAHKVDNRKGRLDLALTQSGPIQGKSGSGTIGTVTFEAIGTGQTTIKLESVRMLDNATPAQVIPVNLEDGLLLLPVADVHVYLPLISR